MREADLIKKAQAIREREHRLKPSLRLKTLEDVVGFIHDRGIVSTLGGNELPSLISALMGKPWKPTGKGFTSWLDWWNLRISGKNAGRLLMDIPRREDIIGTRIFRNSKTYVSRKLWPVLASIVRHYQELASKHEILSQLEWRIIDTLERNGPTRTDKLRLTLNLDGKSNTAKFHRALTQLENHGLTTGYEDPSPEKHLHAAIWHLWNQRIDESMKNYTIPYQEALSSLLERTIDASVLAPEKGVKTWYAWNGNLSQAKEKLLAQGKIIRAESFLLTHRVVE